MSVSFSDLTEYSLHIEQAINELPSAFEKSVKHAGMEFKKAVVPLTPVYEPDPPYHAYDHGRQRVGGKLRKSWKVKAPYRSGISYICEVENDATDGKHYYASDVEYGHRQHVGKPFPVFVNGKLEYRRHKLGYVSGQHFMAIARERTFRGRVTTEYARKEIEKCLRRS